MDLIETLFSPKNVAVVGVSTNPLRWGNWMAEQVLMDEDKRTVYLVHPRGEVILGKQCLKSIDEIPEPIDVAIVTVPNVVFEETIDKLLAHGTKVIIGITVGFGESGNEGYQREQYIVEKVYRAGSLLIGPNCAGLWDRSTNFRCFPIAKLQPGPVGLISQSGGVITDVLHRLVELELGFSKVISVGNQAGVRLADLIAYFDKDPNTEVIALYVENERNVPYHVFEKTSKPIVLLSPDTSPAARRAAIQHTNSILSNAQIVEEATVENGALFASNTRDFVAMIQVALSKLKTKTSRRLMIVTDTGGMGVMAASIAERSGFIVQEPSDKLKSVLKEDLRTIPRSTIGNPIDLISIPGGFSLPTLDALRTLQHADEVDTILLVLFLIEDTDPAQQKECGLQLATMVDVFKKPTVFVCKDLTAPGAKGLLELKMPVYKDLDLAIRALDALCG